MNTSDAYERYIKDISQYQRITPARERKLSRIIQTCRNAEQVEAAINELIHSNLRLVIHCQKEFDKFLSSGVARIAPLDLIAEGNIGLMKAARNFNIGFTADRDDGKRDAVRFSTYACKCIKSHMIRAIKKARFIHIPEHHFAYWTEIETLRREGGGEVSDNELLEKLDVSEEALSLMKHSARSGVCMLEDLTPADADTNWSDFIANENASCPAEETGRHDLRSFLMAEMYTLPQRTQQIISMIYFNENAPTLKDISQLFGISSERCRQICVQGLNSLRRRMFTRRHGIEPGLGLPAEAAA